MEQIFLYITDASSLAAYGLVFLILVACGLGFPLPEDLPLIASGYLIWRGTMEWPLALAVTLFGVGLGDTALYLLGRRLGPALLRGASSSLIKPKKLERGIQVFSKYGEKIVFVARFVAGFRAAVFFVAGITKMPFHRFILLDMFAAVISVPVWIYLGQWLGGKYGDRVEPLLDQVSAVKNYVMIGILILALLAVLRFVLNYRRSKIEIEEATESGPLEAAGKDIEDSPSPQSGSFPATDPPDKQSTEGSQNDVLDLK